LQHSIDTAIDPGCSVHHYLLVCGTKIGEKPPASTSVASICPISARPQCPAARRKGREPS
jgi:hypothetical protein